MYSIYRITGPTGKSYIGYTKQGARVRFLQHLRHSERREKRHPFYDSIKKYGRERFSFKVLNTFKTLEEVKQAEVFFIKGLKPEYNISPGGEDLTNAHEVLKGLFSDPSWAAEYRIKLSDGCRASYAHRKRWPLLKEIGEKFRRENPREAYKIQARAVRCAKKVSVGRPSPTKGTTGEFHHSEESIEKMRVSRKQEYKRHAYRKKVSMGVKESWAKMGEPEKNKRRKNISTGLKNKNASLTEEEIIVRERQLSEARNNIDHEYRKSRQREALVRYWTPERREEKAEFMREWNRRARENI